MVRDVTLVPGAMAFDVCDLLATVQAVFARLLFLLHSLVAIWAATCITNRPQLWALTILCGLFVAETVVSVVKRKGREMKWYYEIIKSRK